MKILIFSDLDGTFMNHNDYSYSHLKHFITKIKKSLKLFLLQAKLSLKYVKFAKV